MRSRLIDSLAHNRQVEELVTSSPVTAELLDRYVAGEDRCAALAVVADLVWKGLSASLTILSDEVSSRGQGANTVEEYLGLLAELASRQLSGQVELSVKLSTIGAGLAGFGDDVALANAQVICRAAQDLGAQVTLEMEKASAVSATLALWEELRSDFPSLGISVQASLHRTVGDCYALAEKGARVRLCKGLFRESPLVAYQKRHEIDLSFAHCLGILMRGGAYPMVATHDPRLVQIAQTLAASESLSADDWESQMLLGVRPLEQRRIADIGQCMRVYVPYGHDWYAYYLHVLAERPDNLRLFVRSLLGRR